jgi:hypothetical protein
MMATTICTSPPKKNVAGSTMAIPLAFGSPVWNMPGMNEVVADAVTADGAGLAIPARSGDVAHGPARPAVRSHLMSPSGSLLSCLGPATVAGAA